MSAPYRLSVVAVVAVAAIAVVVSLLAGPVPPSVADDPVVIEITGLDPIIIGSDNQVVIPPASGGAQVSPQCVDIPGVPFGRACIGSPLGSDQPPLDVVGVEELSPLVKHSAEARKALDWIVTEGADFLSQMYGVPNDGRIERYGRPELRDYIAERLVNIMDKKAYGLALTVDEQRALDFVEADYAADDVTLTTAAYDEFKHFQDVGCGYHPPAAPWYVDEPVALPDKVAKWCARAHNPEYDAFIFAPPIPPVNDFTTWGAYRQSEQLGLDTMGDPKVSEMTRDALVATAAFAAIPAAIGVGALANAFVGTGGYIAAALVKIFPHALREALQLMEALPGAAIGAVAAAIIAAVVVVFLVVTAVSIYLLVEHESVGQTLEDRKDIAAKGEDPLGLEKLAETYTGLPFLSATDPTDPDPYRSSDAATRLMAKVVLWTSVYEKCPPGLPTTGPNACLSGIVVGDPEGLWPDNETTADDVHFERTVDGGSPDVVSSIQVPRDDGFARVRYSDNWAIVREQGEPERARLSFAYKNNGGEPRLVALAPPRSPSAIIVSDPTTSQPVQANLQEVISYRSQDDSSVRARVLRRPTDYLQGPRPSAVGPLLTGRPVILRPNPVRVDGSSLDLAQAQSDFDYQWTVERLNPSTGAWDEVLTSTAFGPSFTPTQAGTYHARVTMDSKVSAGNPKFGAVEFPVSPPPMTPTTLTLLDDGSSQLELDLQITEPVPSDLISVAVTWQGELGDSSNPTTTLNLPCIQTGPLECTTVRTGQFDTLVRTLTSSTDLRRPVSLSISNATGGAATYQLHLDNPGRPHVDPPPDGANAGLPGSVVVGVDATQVEMPLAAGYTEYVAGTLVPGEGGGDDFGLVDPGTGNTVANLELPGLTGVFASVAEDDTGTWHLLVWGNPGLDDLGTYEVPLVLSQTNTNRALHVVVVHVVPSAGNRFRGALENEIDPNNFAVETPPPLFPAVLGGQVEWPAYTGSLCVSLQHRDFGAPPVVRCAPRGSYLKPDGTTRPLDYAEFFPSGMRSGSYQASAWLETPGEHVDTAPIAVGFFLLEDATYPGPSVDLARPTITGKAVQGRRLRAAVGSVDPVGATLSYRWLRDGKSIAAASGVRYRLTAKDVGHRISVRVTGRATDWRATSVTSAKTPKVRRR